MTYQIYRNDSREVVAMIDTEQSEQLVADGYSIKGGEDLKLYVESDHDK